VIVRTFDGLQALTSPRATSLWSGSGGPTGLCQAYAEIYRTQPNVRICVDFLSRNIAQLALHVFRRVSDTDRERLADHDLARWLAHPNPSTRRYRLFESLVGDLGIYFEAYWLKVRHPGEDGRTAIGLVRLPPHEMAVEGGSLPTAFIWTPLGMSPKTFPTSEIVYFNGYNPSSQFRGLSPLETLRRIIAEETAAGEQREQYWRNAGRMEGVWERSKDSPKWTPTQWDEWREQWQKFAGGGARAGETAVGPIASTYKPVTFSAKDSEYIAGGKLRREVCAAAYHIPQPMVGILDHATFSNIKEQHKQTYQDTLGPWLEMIAEEIEGQLLVECDDQTNVYTEFNIAAKLQGSFEEQALALRMLVGRPVMTANEGRARLNLPSLDTDDANNLAAQQGGPSDASVNSSLPPGAGDTAMLVDRAIQAWHGRVASRVGKVPEPDRLAAFDTARWQRELTEDLAPLVGDIEASLIAARVTDEQRRLFELERMAHV
jgi:HK97 family phage portal protein